MKGVFQMKNIKKLLVLLLMTTLFIQITGCTSPTSKPKTEVESTNNNATEEENKEESSGTDVPEGAKVITADEIPENATITLPDGTVVSPDDLPDGVELVPSGSESTKIQP